MTQVRTDPERHRDRVRAINRAVYRAERQLIAAHREEYDRYYAEAAMELGVVPMGPNRRTTGG